MKGTFSPGDQFWVLSQKAENLLFRSRQRLAIHPTMFPVFSMSHYLQHLPLQTSHSNVHLENVRHQKRKKRKNSFQFVEILFPLINFHPWSIRDSLASEIHGDPTKERTFFCLGGYIILNPKQGTLKKLFHSVAIHYQEHHLMSWVWGPSHLYLSSFVGDRKPRSSSCRKSHTFYILFCFMTFS